MLSGLPEDLVRANEGGDTWSPFDVLGHLIHGEKTDWIPRAKIILSDSPDRRFVSFDRFAQFEESKGKSADELLSEFSELRAQNLDELRSLAIAKDDLKRTALHPELGTVNLEQLLNTWVVHDLDHIVQISRTIAKQHSEAVGPWKEFIRVLKQN
ncbi:MAG: DinB family protein [Acidobacteria bacterium]|nr:MAG: DinB family protein [Acidobacteriota bacterium]REK04106.1 MAG: DinB family protein [Acidobacteriota bacterium]REK15268.1 MAG: DinB family protein [Acidobacteriota bacterium]REK46358.1 MAG: DinB family protein [Acidobacteriota bacterium]